MQDVLEPTQDPAWVLSHEGGYAVSLKNGAPSALRPAQRFAVVVRRWAVQRPEQPSIDTFQVPEPEPAPKRPDASALPRPWRTPMDTLPSGPTWPETETRASLPEGR
jgi:hypothetical protein